MSQPVVLNATGDVLLLAKGERSGPGGTLFVFTGATWVGSAVVKINTAGDKATPALANVEYRDRSTGLTVTAGTALTADAIIEVRQNMADVYVTYTHTSGSCTVVSIPAPMNDYVPNPLDFGAVAVDTLTVDGAATIGGLLTASASIAVTGAITFTTLLSSATNRASAALAATGVEVFASTVNGGSFQGFGSTYDLSLRNRAGTVVAAIGANATTWNVVGTTYTAVTTALATSGERTEGAMYSSNGATWLSTNTSTAGNKTGLAYYDGTQYRSGLEISNVASGFTTLLAIKSGGAFVWGNAGVVQTGAAVTSALSVTAASAVAYGFYLNNTLVAAANSDVLTSMHFAMASTPASFTGLVRKAISIAAFSVAAYTTPGNPVGIDIGIITGTGASIATGLQIGIPAGAGTNYILAASTAATFNVTAAGALTCGSSVTGSSLFASSEISTSGPTAKVGYRTGAGGAQTQATDKATTVVSNTVTTAITMNGAALNLLTIVSFTFTNSVIAATDTIICTHESAGTAGAYQIVAFPGAGSAVISVRNNTAGSLSEAIVIRVTIIKSVSA